MQARSSRFPRHRPAVVAVSLVVVLMGLAATGPSPGGASTSKKPKTFHLTAVVKKADQRPPAQTVKLALTKNGRRVGTVKFPGCEGTGTSTICGGTVTIKHVGRQMTALFTWSGSDQNAKSPLQKGNKKFGTMKLTKAPLYNKGQHFPALVKTK
jgi:hypothetical protein